MYLRLIAVTRFRQDEVGYGVEIGTGYSEQIPPSYLSTQAAMPGPEATETSAEPPSRQPSPDDQSYLTLVGLPIVTYLNKES